MVLLRVLVMEIILGPLVDDAVRDVAAVGTGRLGD